MTKILFSSCGANQVSYDTLKTIPVKRLSPTHYPIEHYKVIDALMNSLQEFGDFNITNATYGISHKGERIFCIIEVDTSSKDYGEVISIDMSKGYATTDGVYIYLMVYIKDSNEGIIVSFPIGNWEVEDKIEKEFKDLEEYLKYNKGKGTKIRKQY